MARAFREQVDESIVDRAAALIARRGVAKTSVQNVADAIGLSKAGLLHHFPSKDTLLEAVLAQAGALGQRVLGQVQDMPLGPERDGRAVEILVDIAFAHPGLVALLLAPVTQDGDDGPDVDAVGAVALQAFGVDPEAAASERFVRVVGALAALAVLSIAAHRRDQSTEWRPYVVATCLDALGHRRPGASPPDTPPPDTPPPDTPPPDPAPVET